MRGTKRRTKPRFGGNWLPMLVLIVAVVLIPYVGSDYYLTVLTIAAIWALSAVGMTALLGGSGELNLAYGAFYGVGAYTTALALKHGVPLLPALLLAMLVCGVLTLLMGLPLLRTRGLYYAIVTLSFAILATDVFTEWTSVTKGSIGLTVTPVQFDWIPTYTHAVSEFNLKIYIVAWTATVIMTAILLRLMASPFGMVVRGIGNDEELIESLGFRAARYRLTALTTTGLVVGLSGGVYALYIGYITPDPFTFWTAFAVVIMVVVGGRESVWGSLLAAVALTLLPEVLRFADAYRQIAYAAILYVVVVLSKNRIAGGVSH